MNWNSAISLHSPLRWIIDILLRLTTRCGNDEKQRETLQVSSEYVWVFKLLGSVCLSVSLCLLQLALPGAAAAATTADPTVAATGGHKSSAPPSLQDLLHLLLHLKRERLRKGSASTKSIGRRLIRISAAVLPSAVAANVGL